MTHSAPCNKHTALSNADGTELRGEADLPANVNNYV